MLQELADKSENQGLKMNKSKTRVMMENDKPTYVNKTQIEIDESYIDLGQRYSTRNKQNKKIKENQRRITTGRTAFANDCDILNDKIATCMKRQVYNSCVLLATAFGAVTWALTTQANTKPATAHSKVERSMSTSHTGAQRNIWIREKTKFTDCHVIEHIIRRNWIWAGHVSRIPDNRWTFGITTWKPHE